MDRRERFDDIVEAVRVAFEGMQAAIWTALPGIVETYDPEAGTVRVQPALKARVFSPTSEPPLPEAVLEADNWWTVKLPLLVDVPVVFNGAGGFVMTFPIKPGDECILVFSARPIDNWWYQGGVQVPSLRAMHDLSDAVAIFGPRSRPNVIPDVNPDNAEFRSEDGTVKIEVTPTSINITTTDEVNVTATSKVTLNAPAVEVSDGGALQALMTHSAKTWATTHTHTSATPGNPTSVPIQPFPADGETTVLKAE